MSNHQIPSIPTLGALRSSGWKSRSIQQELRENLIRFIGEGKSGFEGIYGYETTVIPELERAILSGHHICLLGLRGQAKTRLARQMIHFLDEWMPYLEGSELLDDPFSPLSAFGKKQVEDLGDMAPISWMHRSERFTEKLATPDVSVADLIGDVDPIKAAALKLSYSNEQVIHYGLIPRSNRCIFVLNELPDLQARIQVSLFNILQEGDIQIRGFKLRLPLDIQFVFTANPEDYTNRGSIVTPLKDRIDSQILTHYPSRLEDGKRITAQEARIRPGQAMIQIPELAKDLVEQIAIEARKSEFIDARSGVSARMTISAYENLVSAAELRILKNGESEGTVRLTDFLGVVPAITGKVELVYEGEQEGAGIVALNLIGKAIRSLFLEHFPDPESFRKQKQASIYEPIVQFFGEGNVLTLKSMESQKGYQQALDVIPGLNDLIFDAGSKVESRYFLFWKEFVLFGLAECSQISKQNLGLETRFGDLLGSMIDLENLDFGEDEE
jgi:magnesium chelatase subunit I